MLQEFSRILKNTGKLVILISNQELFEKTLSHFTEFNLEEKYPILVSGKKAAIYKIKKLT